MANKPISEKEKMAWDFAEEAHKLQVRKFINQSYFDAHVQKVNGIVKRYTTDEDLLCAALLHDTIEDCFEDKEVGYLEIQSKFGRRVADLVWELTSDEDEIEHQYHGSKKDYLIIKLVHMSDDALIIKLADRLQNISDAFTASKKFRNKYYTETVSIMKYLESHRQLNGIHKLLVGEINAKLDNIKSIFRIKRVDEM